MGRQVVLTGGPGAGKSTLLQAAAAAGWATSPEVARSILQSPGGMALRAEDPMGFAQAMLSAHLQEYQRLAVLTQPALFDRGFADVVGFLEVSGLGVPVEIDRVCRKLRYSGPILRAPPWDSIYRQDAERTQTWDEAVASDVAIIDYGYEVIDLPLDDVSTRLAWLEDQVAA